MDRREREREGEGERRWQQQQQHVGRQQEGHRGTEAAEAVVVGSRRKIRMGVGWGNETGYG